MKGLFIPDITTEMFRNGCLEGIEALMAEGELYDIEYNPKQPTIEPERKKGKWIFKERREPVYDISGVKTWGIAYMCSECGFIHTVIEDFGQYAYCPNSNCGAEIRTPVETARDIVHTAIDNSVWSETVDTAKMHKIVDDKYAEIGGDANDDAES